MNLLDEFYKLEVYEQLKFLQDVAQKYPLRYEYAGIPAHIRVYYGGELREEDIKSREGATNATEVKRTPLNCGD